ncbi:MAG: ATP-binding cassette domain-containing protein [Actinobacteria bacterium]|nr:ATP-binding cassette domain-containing protein [Actinomycetota bacterium]
MPSTLKPPREQVSRDSVGIEYRAVTKSYGPVHALDEVSFSVEPGSFVSLVGPSGCGKSTLLLMTAGLVPTTTGSILIGGGTVNSPQTELGIAFQDATLLDWRDALGNVMLQIEARHMDRSRYEPAARTLLSQVGLDGFERAYPRQMSGGMRQRVSLCRALVHDPPLLLMDEPFGALDYLTRAQLMLDLHNLWYERSKTVLFVTHSVEEAVFLSNRVIIMTPRPGRIDRTIGIDLPTPRNLHVRRSAKFSGYVDEITAAFVEQGVLHESLGAPDADREGQKVDGRPT